MNPEHGEDRAREVVEHLQGAALEVIAALRAFLDVAEELVKDPAKAAAVATSVVESARPAPAGPGDGGADAPASRVTRVRVS